MAAELNHTIVCASDPGASAKFLAILLDLPFPKRFGHFHIVELSNGVALDLRLPTRRSNRNTTPS